MTDPPRAGALHLRGERIDDIGTAEDLCARYPGQGVVHVERITPGVHDAHVHPLFWGQSLGELDLGGLTDPRVVAERVAAHARDLPPGRWIRGRGFLFDVHPEASLLDSAAPQNPVLLESRDIHSAWANHAALSLAHFDLGPPSAIGGAVVRDANGAPTGYLLEGAVHLVAKMAPPPGKEDLEWGLDDLAHRGYTAVHAMGYQGPDGLDWADELANADRLPLRLWWSVTSDRAREVMPGWRGEDLEVAAVKLFCDGALGSRTAWMHEAYPDGSHGMELLSAQALHESCAMALDLGYSLVIHAIGNHAVTDVLAVLRELAPRAFRPFRIEHLQHMRDQESAALHGLPIAISMQPTHLDADADLVRRYLPGSQREAFRFRDVLAAGLPLAFGSDAPVVPPVIEDGLRAATHHALCENQSLSEEEALHAYTRGAALAAGWDDYGTLTVGARADLGLWESGRLVGRVWRGHLEWLSTGK